MRFFVPHATALVARFAPLVAAAACAPTLVGCGGSSGADAAAEVDLDGGVDGGAPVTDAGPSAPDADVPLVDAGPPPPPPPPVGIERILVISQENHTFDTYFGTWCKAPPGSNPTCTQGPECCEAAPAKEPSGASPIVLDDAANAAYDPNHTQSCELGEINGGAMDRFVTGSACSDRRNFAIAPPSVVAGYRALAESGAIADRYFQPVAGQTSANDMFFAVAKSWRRSRPSPSSP